MTTESGNVESIRMNIYAVLIVVIKNNDVIFRMETRRDFRDQ